MPCVSIQQGFNIIWEFCQIGTAEYLSCLRTSPTQYNLLAFVIVMTIHKALSYFCHPTYFLPAEGGLSPFLPLTSPVEECCPTTGRISVSQLDCLQSSELSSVPLFEHKHSLIAIEVEKGYGLKDVKFPQVSWKYLTSQKKQPSNNTPVEGKLLCKFLSFLGNREKNRGRKISLPSLLTVKPGADYTPGSSQGASLAPSLALCSWFLSGPAPRLLSDLANRGGSGRAHVGPCCALGTSGRSSRRESPRLMLGKVQPETAVKPASLLPPVLHP